MTNGILLCLKMNTDMAVAQAWCVLQHGVSPAWCETSHCDQPAGHDPTCQHTKKPILIASEPRWQHAMSPQYPSHNTHKPSL